MATERIQIIVTQSGAVTVKKDIEGVGTGAAKASAQLDGFKGILASLITGAALASIVNYADQFTNLQNRLALVTNSTDELQAKTAELLAVANNARTDFGAVAELYQRTSTAVEGLGISSDRVTKFVDLLSKSTIVSGASAIEATNAIRQLTQGLASGQLRGEEFRAVSEQLPYVLTTVAEAMGVTTGKLREMAYDGQLSPQLLIEAFEKMSTSIQADFDETNATIGQALVLLNNNFTNFIGTISTSTGIFSLLADLIIMVANNLDILAIALGPVVLSFGVLLTQYLGAQMIAAFNAFIAGVNGAAKAFVWLNTVMAANPILALSVALVAVIAYFVDWEVAIQQIIIAWGQFLTVWNDFWGDTEGTKKSIEIVLNAEKAIEDIRKARAELDQSLDSGKAKLYEGVLSGSQAGANELAAGVAKGAQTAAQILENAQAAAMARYEEMNGKAVEALGDTFIEGGDYIYNQVTDSVRKAAPALDDATATGGEKAGKSIETAMNNGANTIFNTIEAAFATLAPLYDVFNAFQRQLDAQISLMYAEMAKLNAETQQIKAETADPDKYGGGGGEYGSDSSSKYSSATMPFAAEYGGDGDTSEPTTTSTTETSITVENYIDPATTLGAIDTAEGNQTVINVVKANREQLQSILGIV